MNRRTEYPEVSLQWLTRINAGGTPDTDNPDYWDGDIPWMASGEVNQGRISTPTEYITERGLKESSTKLFDEGTVVVALAGQGKTKGMAGILQKPAAVNQSLSGLVPRDDQIIPEYLYYCLKSDYQHLRGLAGEGRTGITLSDLKNWKVPVPPKQKQREIVKYLQQNVPSLAELISSLQSLKSECYSKKQSVIYNAVTGMDAEETIPVEAGWINSIPKHWDIVRTRFVAQLESGHTPSKSNDEYWVDCDIPWVTTSDIKPFRDGRKVYLNDTEYKINELGLSNSGARLLPEGTVFLSRTASVGFSGIMGKKMATSQDFANWVCGDEILPEYLLYVFRSMDQEFDRLTQGSTHQTIYMPDIESFKTPLPPIDEQREIVEHIQEETDRIWELIDKVEETIELLEEKRQALITAAVTGQIDLTDWQHPDKQKASP
ncbi:restriction endonuclease subunit S [Haloarcula sp. JP-L23]|uniref:restriction endonuclease subunit S n=1 Tax=Haloarcula sp. JP-L23 TaxID=2716717 RepID=UPI00140F0C36|nr:restriction endonuclease subunit S [Haloarcula sp. JP-L23]